MWLGFKRKKIAVAMENELMSLPLEFVSENESVEMACTQAIHWGLEELVTVFKSKYLSTYTYIRSLVNVQKFSQYSS